MINSLLMLKLGAVKKWLLQLSRLSLLVITCWAGTTYAQQVSEAEYKQLMEAQALMEEAQWEQAQQVLALLTQPQRSAFVKALGFYNLGKIAIERDRFSEAIKRLKQARELQALSDEQQLQLLHSIGQLHCQIDQWSACARVLSQWVKLAPSLVMADDYIMIAQAYAQQEQWQQSLTPVGLALKHWKARSSQETSPPQNWYQLAVVAHVELKQWQQAVSRQQQLLKHYPADSEDWRQLVSLHLQRDDWTSALAVQRMGYERGLLVAEKDYRLLTQLLLNKGMPLLAGDVLSDGLDKKRVKESEDSLELLCQSWLRAKEWQRAENAIARLNSIKPTVKRAQNLAQVQMELGHWQAASKSLSLAVRLSNKPSPDLQLLLGIVHINLKNYDTARVALDRAKASKEQREVSS